MDTPKQWLHTTAHLPKLWTTHQSTCFVLLLSLFSHSKVSGGGAESEEDIKAYDIWFQVRGPRTDGQNHLAEVQLLLLELLLVLLQELLVLLLDHQVLQGLCILWQGC